MIYTHIIYDSVPIYICLHIYIQFTYIYLYIYILFQNLFLYSLLQNTKYSSLGYTVGPSWPAILYIVVVVYVVVIYVILYML